MNQFFYLFESLRPKQWVKNLIVFAALIFAQKALVLKLSLRAVFAFVVFCGISSCIYLINDLKDIKKDKLHPDKSRRPLASGKLSKSPALLFLICFTPLFLFLAFWFNLFFGIVVFIYFVLMLAYTFYLKEIVILDAFIISTGYVLRGVAGAVIVSVEISFWFFICASLLALFIVFCKRRHELLILDAESIKHRRVLVEYNTLLLDQFISIVAASTVVAYSLYTVAPETILKFHTENLIFTIPFVLFGLFRYLYLVYKKDGGGSAEKIMLSDKPLIFDMFAWLLVVFLVL